MEDRSHQSPPPSAPPLVLEYARPLPVRFPLPGKTPRFTILFGMLISGTLIVMGVTLLMVGAMLCWSSMEVTRGDSPGMQISGCYMLLIGVILPIVGTAGHRMARRQWRAR